MKHPPFTQPINLNVNLISFPSPIQLSINHKMTKSSLQQQKNKNMQNHSMNVNKKEGPQVYDNFQDEMDDFHPTISTESLCKVKKMYEKTMKSKGFGRSLDDFFIGDAEKISKNPIKHSKASYSKQSQSQRQSSNHDTSKSNRNSQNFSNPSSRNSTEHLFQKQPIEEIQCYDTFQQDDEFVRFDLLNGKKNVKEENQKAYKKDSFKKNNDKKVWEKGETMLKKKIVEEQNVECNRKNERNFNRSKELKASLNEQENKPFLINVQKSKSKSRSKSKSKQKNCKVKKSQILRKLPLAKNIKSTHTNSKNLTQKSPLKQKISKSPLKEFSQSYQLKEKSVQKRHSRVQNKKSKSKSRSKSKNQKKFIRSNIQIETSNHHTFSPSPASNRYNKSKSFSRSRSHSNQKSRSKSNNKSTNSKNIKLQKSKSPKRLTQKKTVVKEFNIKSTSELMEKRRSASKQLNKLSSLSKEKLKRSTGKEQRATSRQKKAKKGTINAQQGLVKQCSQQVLKSSQFSKNKGKKVVYAKPDIKTSPNHSRSTNFYLPERKQSAKQKVNPLSTKQQSQKRYIPQNNKKHSLKQKKPHHQKSKIESSTTNNADPSFNSMKVTFKRSQDFYQTSQVIGAIETIQRVYRGYKVRKQLNEDLGEICRRVQKVRGKIDDKRSKYWIRTGEEKELSQQASGTKKQRQNESRIKSIKQMLMFTQKNNSHFESLLSSSNSIQQIGPSRSSGHINQNSQLMYLQQMVNKDFQLNERFLEESEKLKEHIRSISSEHLKGGLGVKENNEEYPEEEDRGNTSEEGQRDEENLLEKSEEEEDQQSPSSNCQSDESEKQQQQQLRDSIASQPSQILQQPKSHSTHILPTLQPASTVPTTFQFYQAYSPKHYIVSPKNNPSPNLSKMISPISSVSSHCYFNQIPFSLQSPKNILEGENLFSQKKSECQDDEKKQRFFQAKQEESKEEENIREKQVMDDGNSDGMGVRLSDELEKKIKTLKRLFYEDKLLSATAFQNKINILKAQITPLEAKMIDQMLRQPQIDEPLKEPELNSIGKKMKITQLTEKLNIQSAANANQQKQNPKRALFVGQSQRSLLEQADLEPQIKQLNQRIYYQEASLDPEDQQQNINQSQKEQPNSTIRITSNPPSYPSQHQHQHQNQPQQQQESHHSINHQFYQRCGFPTQLLFIKNYIFEFFAFIKSNPAIEKKILTNLLSLPYDNEHLLTCYRTQLQEIDYQYYENKVEGQFLAYPYWRNLIDYQPVIDTEVYQKFAQSFDQGGRRQDNIFDEENDPERENNQPLLFVTDEQDRIFYERFKTETMSLKDIQKIFLLMLMEVFNQAFEEERCVFRQLSLVKFEKGGMNNEHAVRQALKKIEEIDEAQRLMPAYYMQETDSQRSTPSNVSHQPQPLQSSQNYRFFITHQLRQKKQEYVDVIFCSVLKHVLQNWGRSMCGLIIEPEEEEAMNITPEQIHAKNNERLCEALNKHVVEYEKELEAMMREHEVATRLVLGENVVEVLMWEVVGEIVGLDRGWEGVGKSGREGIRGEELI